MRNRVGIQVLGDSRHLVTFQNVQNGLFATRNTNHVLIEDFNFERGRNAGHDFNAAIFRFPMIINNRARMFRFKGIGDPQRNVILTQALGGTWVDGFHAHVRQLIGHVIAGPANRAYGIFTNDARVSAREMEFLVNDRFTGLSQAGNAREGHFTVATAIDAHQAFAALSVTCGDRKLV